MNFLSGSVLSPCFAESLFLAKKGIFMQKFFPKNIVLMAVFLLLSCASARQKNIVTSPENLAQIEKNKKEKLPLWVDCNFKSSESALFLKNYSGEKGFYASGKGDSHVSARINARRNLIDFCKEQDSTQDAEVQQIFASRIIDSFIDENGISYILIFISERDARKSF